MVSFGAVSVFLFAFAGVVCACLFRLLFGTFPENSYLCTVETKLLIEMEVSKTQNPNEARIQELTEELDALATEWKRNQILTLQKNVQSWAIRFNRWPRILRPVCLHYFKKWAKRYNSVVCTLYPPAPGAPLPVEELVLDVA